MRACLQIIVTVVIFATLSACAAHPDPIVDMKGVDEADLAVDWRECEAYSEEVVIAKGIARGGATGAAVGALAGAIGGDSGDVADGAAGGALYGGTRSGLDADKEKQRVFKRCLSGRGYRVLN
jgi:hypothetical protein